MGISSLEIDGIFNSYLFSGTNRAILESILLEEANVFDFKKNCTIYDRGNYFNGLGMIINGSAIVIERGLL